jgi:hypothetical protein
LDESGPIDYLVIEWPADHHPNGSSLQQLRELVERGVVRVLDLAFVRKEAGGGVEVPITELGFAGDIDLSLFAEARSGLLDADDLDQAATAMDDGCVGGVLVFENAWAAPFAKSLRANGARLVANGRIPVQAILATLDELDSSS